MLLFIYAVPKGMVFSLFSVKYGRDVHDHGHFGLKNDLELQLQFDTSLTQDKNFHRYNLFIP